MSVASPFTRDDRFRNVFQVMSQATSRKAGAYLPGQPWALSVEPALSPTAASKGPGALGIQELSCLWARVGGGTCSYSVTSVPLIQVSLSKECPGRHPWTGVFSHVVGSTLDSHPKLFSAQGIPRLGKVAGRALSAYLNLALSSLPTITFVEHFHCANMFPWDYSHSRSRFAPATTRQGMCCYYGAGCTGEETEA